MESKSLQLMFPVRPEFFLMMRFIFQKYTSLLSWQVFFEALIRRFFSYKSRQSSSFLYSVSDQGSIQDE